MWIKFISLVGLLLSAACSGPGNSTPVGQQGIISNLQTTPTILSASLSKPSMVFGYVDAGMHNGAFPSGSDLRAAFDAINPNPQTGTCSAISTISVGTIFENPLNPGQPPAVVIAYYPRTIGTCSQIFNLPGNNSGVMTLSVNP